ncbi:hypothetical protein [uncultured Hymenobacter sp.]|uniref:hypothetical protein n=1 Tax=uncultured Hymenobacter sp. TaxID=170016 RepID=UPI0035C9AD2B
MRNFLQPLLAVLACAGHFPLLVATTGGRNRLATTGGGREPGRASWRRCWGGAPLMVLSLLGSLPGRAQQVLVQADVAADTLRADFGPNRRYFGHLFVGGGLVLGPAGGAGARLRYGPPSRELELGARLKRRYSPTLALTLAVRYARLSYGLAQTGPKIVPGPTRHRRESLTLHQAQLEGGLRLNAGHRGNIVGHYLDLLAWGGWVAGTAHRTEDDPAPGAGASTSATTGRGLRYLARWPAGLGLRLGSGRLALTGRYRLTAVFRGREASAWPELPRGVLGLEIGLF